jgi:3-hydroxypropanoate dehydrogenase
MAQLDDQGLDLLFRGARTRGAWSDEKIPERLLRDVYELASLGPTSLNSSPARFLFLTSEAAKARLIPLLSEGNRAKSAAAPCLVIIGHDLAFGERFPVLFPARPGLKDRFADQATHEPMAFRNGTLQGAYLIIAARALGLDAGPMSGFDNAGVDKEFFAGSAIRSNFVCALGYATDEPKPRLPRLSFEDACQIL